MWGLSQAGILANRRLWRKLAPFGYNERVNMPGLWKHKTQHILFTLVVNNFGVKYVSKNDINHLIASIKTTYTPTEDWTGNLYCGITLEWDYVNQNVDISMQITSRKNYRNMAISSQLIYTVARTTPNPENLAHRCRPLSLPTLPIPLMPRASNEFNKSWVAFYFMPRPLT